MTIFYQAIKEMVYKDYHQNHESMNNSPVKSDVGFVKKMAAKVLLSNRGAHGIFTAAVIPLWLPANTLAKSFTTALALEAANTDCKKNYNNEELQ